MIHPEVADRYIGTGASFPRSSSGTFGNPLDPSSGGHLAIHADPTLSGFIFRQTLATATDIDSKSTKLGHWTIATFRFQETSEFPLRFYVLWIVEKLWEYGNFEVACTERDQGSRNDGSPSP